MKSDLGKSKGTSLKDEGTERTSQKRDTWKPSHPDLGLPAFRVSVFSKTTQGRNGWSPADQLSELDFMKVELLICYLENYRIPFIPGSTVWCFIQ